MKPVVPLAPDASSEVSREELLACTRVLEALVADRGRLLPLSGEERAALMAAAGRVAQPTRGDAERLTKAKRLAENREKSEQRERDRELRASTHIRTLRR